MLGRILDRIESWFSSSSTEVKLGFSTYPCTLTKDSGEEQKGWIWAVQVLCPNREVASRTQHLLYEKIGTYLELVDPTHTLSVEKGWQDGTPYVRPSHFYKTKETADMEMVAVREHSKKIMERISSTTTVEELIQGTKVV